MTLDWRSATAEHRQYLSTFSCTLPEHCEFDEDLGVVSHDYPWEVEVQEFIRSLRPPSHPPEFLCLGFDEIGLAAVISMRVRRLDRFCFIQAVAVAHRASGHGLAGEAIGIARNVMGRHGIESDYLVQARVDPRNVAAQSAFEKSGYTHVGNDAGWETWAKEH